MRDLHTPPLSEMADFTREIGVFGAFTGTEVLKVAIVPYREK